MKHPKDKKVILACVTGQTQNLPIPVLRSTGYNAYTMAFGHTARIKGYLGADFMQTTIQMPTRRISRWSNRESARERIFVYGEMVQERSKIAHYITRKKG